MADVIAFGDPEKRKAEKAQKTLDRAGHNDMLIARILGAAPVEALEGAPPEPRDPNVRR
jgi:hypothetical protein